MPNDDAKQFDKNSDVFGLPISEERVMRIVAERFQVESEEFRKARKAVWACLHQVAIAQATALRSAEATPMEAPEFLYLNQDALIKRLRIVQKNPRMYGPTEVADLCGVAADAMVALKPRSSEVLSTDTEYRVYLGWVTVDTGTAPRWHTDRQEWVNAKYCRKWEERARQLERELAAMTASRDGAFRSYEELSAKYVEACGAPSATLPGWKALPEGERPGLGDVVTSVLPCYVWFVGINGRYWMYEVPVTPSEPMDDGAMDSTGGQDAKR